MTLSHTPLVASLVQQLPAAVAPVYTNAAATTTYLRGYRLYNSGTSAETVKIHLVAAAAGAVGTAAAANQILEYILQPKESLTEDFPATGVVLAGENDTVQASATTAATVTLVLFGDLGS